MNKKVIIVVFTLTMVLVNWLNARSFEDFKSSNTKCYDREKEPHTFVVDAHTHFRPFGGPAIPFSELIKYYKKEEVFFVNIFGIGQKLPWDSECTYYLDCPGTSVTPSLSNDFINAANIARYKPKNFHITLSMTFPDLSKPKEILENIKLLDKEYPNLFKWMGEVNLVKQALFPNGHNSTPMSVIAKWKDFMKVLRDRDIPISFHSDIGHNGDIREQTKYLGLMLEVLNTYPDNKIVWHHMGLSKELTELDPKGHIEMLKKLLDSFPNLYLDFAWRVIPDYYFKEKKSRDMYVKFFNEYSTKLLAGTDFVAAKSKKFYMLKEEIDVNSEINKYLNDEAFRNIVLGENYFKLLNLPYKAPTICKKITIR